MGAAVESTNERQAVVELRVYPGADGSFDLYSDDGTTYAYEKGAGEIAHLRWDEAGQKLTRTGAEVLGVGSAKVVTVRAR
jgi:alpha-glucosidase (family GH31 glycosyl hydrolase)